MGETVQHFSYWASPDAALPGETVFPNGHFTWNGDEWYAPAAGVCKDGLVLELCRRIDPAALTAFYNAWQGREDTMTPQQEELCQAQNPAWNPDPADVRLNGMPLPVRGSCAVCWAPGLPGEDSAARVLVRRYGLDPAFGWAFVRTAVDFPQAGALREGGALAFTLSRGTRLRTAFVFTAAPGQQLCFARPSGGERCTLTVETIETRELPVENRRRPGWIYPNRVQVLCYRLTPDLPRGTFALRDADPGDVACPAEPGQTAAKGPAGVIGMADGPTAIFMTTLAQQGREPCHTACSAVRFRQDRPVRWRGVFEENICPDGRFVLPLPACGR